MDWYLYMEATREEVLDTLSKSQLSLNNKIF